MQTTEINDFCLQFGFSETAESQFGVFNVTNEAIQPDLKALFIPAKEVLTFFRAIEHTRTVYEFLDFDDTYYDLVKSLKVPTSEGRLPEGYAKVGHKIEELFEGSIQQNLDDPVNQFIFKKGNTQFTMPLTAEGIKKVGILTTLIRNRELGKNTLLFLDEPETALHPDAQRKLAEFLFILSQAEGVQIYLTTHSYFIANQLAIIAQREQTRLNAICLSRKRGARFVDVKIENLQHGLPDISILREAVAMFEEKMDLDFAGLNN